MGFLNCVIAIPISLLLFLKTYELFRSLWWAKQHGAAYAAELHLLIKNWRKMEESGLTEAQLEDVMKEERKRFTDDHKRTWSMEEWPVGRLFMRLPGFLKKIMVDIMFRLPTLIIAQTLIIFFATSREVIMLGIGLIWLSLWADVSHNIVNVLNLGYMNGYFRRTISTNRLSHDSSPYPHASEVSPSRRQLVRGFTTLFAGLLTLNIIGYTGIYFGLDILSRGSFNGLEGDSMRSLDLLYFSIVTLATVGYGDIHPQPDAIWVRFAVASQILNGVSLTVFLLTSFSLTIDPE